MSGVSQPVAAPRLVRLVDWYQRAADGRPSPCRFSPSCSSYAREALLVHGTRRGLWLTVRRLARCRPFGPSGWDPVPPAADECGHPDHHPRADHHDQDLVPAVGPTKDR
jgi:uncharacterized protein